MIRVDAFDLRTGRRIGRLPGVSSLSWSESWNDKGGMSVEVTTSESTRGVDLDGMLVEQRTVLAARDGARILHAGPILASPEWDPASNTVKVSCGGGWDLFDWRLVLDLRLKDRPVDGEVLVDEDNPGYEWIVGYGGSGGDIIKGLIALTKAWDPLPVAAPTGYGPTVGSPLSAQWKGWDFRTVSDAFDDVLSLERGGQLRFDPELLTDGRLQWRARWAVSGITDHAWKWNATLPGQRVRFTGLAAGSTPVIGEVWATGGRNEDKLLMTRAADDSITAAGWPLLQKASSGQSDGSLAQLHSYARTTLAASRRDRTWKLSVGVEHDVRVGDHIDLRVHDPFVHDVAADGAETSTVIPLVVTDVNGDASSDWLDVQARQRASSVDGVRPGTGDPMRLVSRNLRTVRAGLAEALAPSATQVYQTNAKLRDLRGAQTKARTAMYGDDR